MGNETPNHPTVGWPPGKAELTAKSLPSQSSGPGRWGQQTTNTKPSQEQKRSSRNGEAGEISSAEGEAAASPAKLLRPGQQHGKGTRSCTIPAVGGGRAVTSKGSQPHKALTCQCGQVFLATIMSRAQARFTPHRGAFYQIRSPFYQYPHGLGCNEPLPA